MQSGLPQPHSCGIAPASALASGANCLLLGANMCPHCSAWRPNQLLAIAILHREGFGPANQLRQRSLQKGNSRSQTSICVCQFWRFLCSQDVFLIGAGSLLTPEFVRETRTFGRQKQPLLDAGLQRRDLILVSPYCRASAPAFAFFETAAFFFTFGATSFLPMSFFVTGLSLCLMARA